MTAVLEPIADIPVIERDCFGDTIYVVPEPAAGIHCTGCGVAHGPEHHGSDYAAAAQLKDGDVVQTWSYDAGGYVSAPLSDLRARARSC